MLFPHSCCLCLAFQEVPVLICSGIILQLHDKHRTCQFKHIGLGFALCYSHTLTFPSQGGWESSVSPCPLSAPGERHRVTLGTVPESFLCVLPSSGVLLSSAPELGIHRCSHSAPVHGLLISSPHLWGGFRGPPETPARPSPLSASQRDQPNPLW